MELAKLGNSELRVSRLGFGCWAIGGHGYGKVDKADSIKAIHGALDAGINFFDTSDTYGFGQSESVLAEALGNKARDVVIATKFGVRWDAAGKTYKDCSPAHIQRALEGSLRRLRVDCIPLYQLNWYDEVTPLDDIVDVLERCRESGKVSYLGFSNMRAAQWGDLLHHFSSTQIPYGINQRTYASEIERLAPDRIGALAYSVLSRGLFAREYGDTPVFGEGDTRSRDPDFTDRLPSNRKIYDRLKTIGGKYGKTPAQVAIRWVLDSQVTCALVGMKTRMQADENVGALGWRLEPHEWNWLANAGVSK